MAIIIVMALSWLCGPIKGAPYSQDVDPSLSPDSITVSLVTCFPGPEIFELYGHEGIRVRGEGIDSVWNYGIFDFDEPNFVYRFVKGDTDYKGAGYPFAWFLPGYRVRGSKVVEQDLNLSQKEANQVLALLRESTLPENRKYRYNYVKNNCATRIYQLVDSALDVNVVYTDSVVYGTFRNEMRHYNEGYPWYQFGIDIALGSGIDYPLNSKEEMFVPVELMRKAAGATLSDGRPLVKATRVINEGVADATLPPTPWYASPLFWSWVIFISVVIFCIFSLKSAKMVRWVYSLWFLILGISGTLVAFLVFISSHEATSPNILIFWLNPLQLLFAILLWWKKCRPISIAIAYYNIIAMTGLLILWPLQKQSANPAFFPLMAVTLFLATTYAILSWKLSYNNNGAAQTESLPQQARKRQKSHLRKVKAHKS